jgi:hypothetical protein
MWNDGSVFSWHDSVEALRRGRVPPMFISRCYVVLAILDREVPTQRNSM